MADEQETIVPTEQAEPATETEVETHDEPEVILEPGEAEELAALAADNAEPDIEYVSLERNGKTYSVPKELEAEFLMQADYTRKTQSVAEKTKALEARQSELEQQAEVTETELNDRAASIAIKTRLDEYAKVDWDALEAQDPLGAQKHWRTYQQLQQAAGEVQSRLQNHTAERTQKAQQDFAKRIEETTAFAKEHIPGWSTDMEKKVIDFAISKGVSQDFLRKNISPVLFEFAHLAFIGNQTMTKQAAPKSLTAPPIPLRTVGGKSTPAASTDLSSASMDAYVAARKKGVGGKALR